MDLPSLSSLGRAGAGSAAQVPNKDAIKAELQSQIASENAQRLVTTATEKCYAKCVTAPSTSLSSREQTCLTRCLDQYLKAFNIVSQTYVNRLASERQAAGIGATGIAPAPQ
ncbi:protein translocase subunit [Tilletia horrida]|uniref:Mitochondrial import inner membrane translocase subunit n=1 Tax=Tilletia horrida TaxID=155126 RepID=A0AAN6JR63_9BASI|nr:protein translocase subunit [Tilletia horrida]KAK0549508.1 protein translocase subunit [Tilletia horrida]KAK0564275.1 protein translocase subunit [Tilletia horrida]